MFQNGDHPAPTDPNPARPTHPPADREPARPTQGPGPAIPTRIRRTHKRPGGTQCASHPGVARTRHRQPVAGELSPGISPAKQPTDQSESLGSTQSKVLVTAFFHFAYSFARCASSICGSHRLDSAQLVRMSSSLSQNPTARPAA